MRTRQSVALRPHSQSIKTAASTTKHASTRVADGRGFIRSIQLGLLLCLLFAVVGKCLSQEVASTSLPDLPAPHAMVRNMPIAQPVKRDFATYMKSRTTRTLIAADFGVRMLDAVSTRQFMTNPCKCMHETELGPIAGSTPGMYAYSIAVAGAVEFGAFELWKHGHPKIARMVQLGEIAGDGEAGIHNEILNASH